MKMKPMAVAVAAALPVTALAATLNEPSGNHVSAEYLALNKALTGLAPTIDLGAQYAVDDVLTVTFSSAPKAATSGVNATRAYSFPNTLAIVVGDEGGLDDGVASFFSATDTTVSYRVTEAPDADSSGDETDFGTVTIGAFGEGETGMVFFPSADVTFSSVAETASGKAFDAGKTAAGASAQKLYDIVGSQFAATIGGLSQTVDVESARKKFATSGGAATSHTVTVAVAFNVGSPDAAYALTGDDVDMVLTGDFSWVDSSTATTATGVTAGNVDLDDTDLVAAAVGATKITVSGIPADANGTDAGVVTLANSLKLVIPTQTLTATLTANYDESTKVTSSATASGAYTLNGSTVTVFAVPTSERVDNLIWLSNTGTSDGEVSITVYDKGKTHELGVVGTSKGGTEFDVTAALEAGLAAKGVTLSGGRVHMDIVTTAPAKDIAVSAVYRVGDDRVNLVTSLEAPRS